MTRIKNIAHQKVTHHVGYEDKSHDVAYRYESELVEQKVADQWTYKLS